MTSCGVHRMTGRTTDARLRPPARADYIFIRMLESDLHHIVYGFPFGLVRQDVTFTLCRVSDGVLRSRRVLCTLRACSPDIPRTRTPCIRQDSRGERFDHAVAVKIAQANGTRAASSTSLGQIGTAGHTVAIEWNRRFRCRSEDRLELRKYAVIIASVFERVAEPARMGKRANLPRMKPRAG